MAAPIPPHILASGILTIMFNTATKIYTIDLNLCLFLAWIIDIQIFWVSGTMDGVISKSTI